jgi:hypothetical protein
MHAKNEQSMSHTPNDTVILPHNNKVNLNATTMMHEGTQNWKTYTLMNVPCPDASAITTRYG